MPSRASINSRSVLCTMTPTSACAGQALTRCAVHPSLVRKRQTTTLAEAANTDRYTRFLIISRSPVMWTSSSRAELPCDDFGHLVYGSPIGRGKPVKSHSPLSVRPSLSCVSNLVPLSQLQRLQLLQKAVPCRLCLRCI